MNMKTQLATIRITGAVEKSTAVMASMSRLIKIPELQKTMTSMSKEMTKMGIIDEMMDDAMSSLDPEDIEEAADTEVKFYRQFRSILSLTSAWPRIAIQITE